MTWFLYESQILRIMIQTPHVDEFFYTIYYIFFLFLQTYISLYFSVLSKGLCFFAPQLWAQPCKRGAAHEVAELALESSGWWQTPLFASKAPSPAVFGLLISCKCSFLFTNES